MSQLLPNGKQQFIDANGNPIAGGTISFYQPGTLTPVNTYQDQALSIVNPNPITLDSAGRATVWVGDGVSVRQILKDAQGNVVWDVVSGMDGFSNPMSAVGDLIVGGVGGAPTRLGVPGSGQVLYSNGTNWTGHTLTASDVGADPAGAAAALGGIGGQATLVLSGYTIATNAGVITVSASAPSGTPANGQLWFQHA